MNSLLVIILVGSILLLSFLLLANPLKVNHKANVLFGIFLLLWASYWIEEVASLALGVELSHYQLLIVRSLQFLTPVLLYYSVIFYTNPDYRLSKKDGFIAILPIIYWSLLLSDISSNYRSIAWSLTVIVLIQAVILVSLSYKLIHHHKRRIKLFESTTDEIDLHWLESIILALIGLCFFIVCYNLVFSPAYLNIIANLISLIIVYFIGYHIIKQEEIFVLDSKERELVLAASHDDSIEKKKLLSDDALKDLKTKLLHVMAADHPYLDAKLSLSQLADTIDVTPHQLSYVINEGFQENFFTFVNNYRISKVKSYLKDESKSHLAIMGIAYECGFNSKSSFYSTFKKITNMTPSEYIKKSSTL